MHLLLGGKSTPHTWGRDTSKMAETKKQRKDIFQKEEINIILEEVELQKHNFQQV